MMPHSVRRRQDPVTSDKAPGPNVVAVPRVVMLESLFSVFGIHGKTQFTVDRFSPKHTEHDPTAPMKTAS